VVVVRVGRGNN